MIKPQTEVIKVALCGECVILLVAKLRNVLSTSNFELNLYWKKKGIQRKQLIPPSRENNYVLAYLGAKFARK